MGLRLGNGISASISCQNFLSHWLKSKTTYISPLTSRLESFGIDNNSPYIIYGFGQKHTPSHRPWTIDNVGPTLLTTLCSRRWACLHSHLLNSATRLPHPPIYDNAFHCAPNSAMFIGIEYCSYANSVPESSTILLSKKLQKSRCRSALSYEDLKENRYPAFTGKYM